MFKKYIALAFISLFSLEVSSTVVEIRTVEGNIQVNLFDEHTPETVSNFLSYVDSGAYANNVVHRLEPGFVMQAGGFQYNNELPLDAVPTGVAVVNEPELSNVLGTIAMAKQPGNPDSATSQWFINLADNSQNLDVQNSGFTVFGQVIGNGMEVVERIATLSRFNLGGAATSIPLRDYTESDAVAGIDPTGENFVLITDIVVIDAETVTNPDLVPKENTLIKDQNSGGNNTPATPGSGSSGGSINPFSLLAGLLFVFFVRRKVTR